MKLTYLSSFILKKKISPGRTVLLAFSKLSMRFAYLLKKELMSKERLCSSEGIIMYKKADRIPENVLSPLQNMTENLTL